MPAQRWPGIGRRFSRARSYHFDKGPVSAPSHQTAYWHVCSMPHNKGRIADEGFPTRASIMFEMPSPTEAWRCLMTATCCRTLDKSTERLAPPPAGSHHNTSNQLPSTQWHAIKRRTFLPAACRELHRRGGVAHTDMPDTFAKNRSQWSVRDAMLYNFHSTTQVENAHNHDAAIRRPAGTC